MTSTRLISPDDARELSQLLIANQAFMAPWEPLMPEGFYTEAGVRSAIEHMLEGHEIGVVVPHLILDAQRIVGRITLSNVVRLAFQSCNVGYWVAEADNGRGHATKAVSEMCRIAFSELGLHRVEAGTLRHNTASQTVLKRNGFVQFGLAPAYLKIAGRWQDHVLLQKINPDP